MLKKQGFPAIFFEDPAKNEMTDLHHSAPDALHASQGISALVLQRPILYSFPPPFSGTPTLSSGLTFARVVVAAAENDETRLDVLERVEREISTKVIYHHDWLDALKICEDRGLTDRRVRTFLEKCLEKIVKGCIEVKGRIEHGERTERLKSTLLIASNQMGTALSSDFLPWAGKSLVALMPERNASGVSSLPDLFHEPDDAFAVSEIFIECSSAVASKVQGMLHQLSLRDLLIHYCRDVDRIDHFEAVLRACNVSESKDPDKPCPTLLALAQRLVQQLSEIPFNEVPAVLTDDGINKQMTDGLEGLDRILQLAGDSYKKDGQQLLRRVAVQCIHSQKLMLRRAGLEILAKLAEIVPHKASEWMVVAGDAEGGGQGQSILDCLTGERAHENLVDALRNCVYTLARQRMLSDSEDSEQHMHRVTKRIIDSMLSTCVGDQQHPTKDVRDAFRRYADVC